jgi:hypothetical protein
MPLVFTDADHGNWGIGTALKLALWADRVSLSGLEEARAESREVQTRRRAAPISIIRPQVNAFTTKHALNSDSGTGNQGIWTLLSKIYLGTSSPSAYRATLGGGTHTISRLYSTGIAAKIGGRGTAVLCGTRGDGKGDGRVHVVQDEATDYIDLAMDTNAQMVDGDFIWLSYTLFPDETADMQYVEWLFIGKSGRQLNCIGCQANAVRFSGLNVADGDEPLVEIDWTAAKTRWEPAASEATLSTTDAPHGPDPVATKGEGAMLIGDAGYGTPGQTHGYLETGGWDFDPGLGHTPWKSSLGVNGIGGYKFGIGRSTFGVNVLIDEGSPAPIPQYDTDFQDGTHEKQLVFQHGHIGGACMALEMSKAYFDKRPSDVDIDGFEGVRLEGHADEDNSTGATAITRADHRIHFFHSS